jgi:AraC-like DNA-binding protein
MLEQVCPVVTTVVDPSDRSRVDAGSHGRFRPLHTESVSEALRAVRERPINTVLLSPRRVDHEQLPSVTSLVRQFPGVATVAVVCRPVPEPPARLLALGACGVRRVLDLNGRDGWLELRALVADTATPTTGRILAGVLPPLADASPDCRRFFELTVRLAPTTVSVRALTQRLGVGASTLMSRFFRAALPSPKRYLAGIRLLYAAGLLASPGFAMADVAYRLDYSSPQSFGRHLRSVLGITAADFRRRYPFEVALADFVARLIEPFRETFRTFRPLHHGVADLGHR